LSNLRVLFGLMFQVERYWYFFLKKDIYNRPLKYFIGIKVAKVLTGLFLSQYKYALHTKAGMFRAKFNNFCINQLHKLFTNPS